MSLVKNAVMPRCQIHEWMPEPFCSDRKKYGCKKESVKRVRSTIGREPFTERWFWLCHKDAELVEQMNQGSIRLV
jgi:hypothetical protein